MAAVSQEVFKTLVTGNIKLLRSLYDQYWPPPAAFKLEDVPSQEGRVFIVTGANQGLGFELAKLLYHTGATTYLACRSEEKAEKAIQDIVQASPPTVAGKLRFLHLDLDDLAAVRRAAAAFAAQESKLDILWNNAAVGGQPLGSKTKQGIEIHVGTNCVAPLFFARLLLPQLHAAAATAPANSVRIVFSSSLTIETHSPRGGGIDFKDIDSSNGTTDGVRDYAASKCGNWFLAIEGAKRFGGGVLSVTQNPGMLKTAIWKHQGSEMIAIGPTLFDPSLGALTMLYAGFSSEVTNGGHVIPWGRMMAVEKKFPRKDILFGKTRPKSRPRRKVFRPTLQRRTERWLKNRNMLM